MILSKALISQKFHCRINLWFYSILFRAFYGKDQNYFYPFILQCHFVLNQGKCSDNYGRKYVLQICFLFCAMSYLVLSISTSVFMVFFSRIPAGQLSVHHILIFIFRTNCSTFNYDDFNEYITDVSQSNKCVPVNLQVCLNILRNCRDRSWRFL